jgi:hypothetical protein
MAGSEEIEDYNTPFDAEETEVSAKMADTIDNETAPEETEVYDWSAFYDAEGNIYYCNSKTEESSWDAPAEYNPPPPLEGVEPEEETSAATEATDAEEPNVDSQSSSKWTAFTDDEGREYYYNNESGETQWEKPDNFLAPTTETNSPEDAMDATFEPAESSVKDTDDVLSEGSDKPEVMEVEEEELLGDYDAADIPEEPEEETIDPAVKRAQDAEAALNKPDSILEPGCIGNVTEVVTSEGGNPQKAIHALIDNYHGQSAICGLLGRWLADLRSSSSTDNNNGGGEQLAPSQGVADDIRGIAQDVVNRVAKERFSKESGDSILDLSKSEAAFLEEMMDSTRWRKLLIDLSASHKDSAVLMYCLRAISKRGHHREIARRVNQSDHFAVFNAMLLSELTVIGKLAVSAGGDSTTSIGLEELISDLRRTCTSTSYTYLYSLEVLRYLQVKAREELIGNSSHRFKRAIRKWELLGQHLETAMVDPSASSSVAGASPLFRKRRLDVALTLSELHQRQRRRLLEDNTSGNGKAKSSALETALLTFLRRHSIGIQLDDAILDPLLPKGLDFSGADDIGKLLIQHPLSIKALLGQLYRPGSTRVTTAVVKNKCARLVSLAVMAAEKEAMAEIQQVESSGSDEVALTRMILQGGQLCEQMETMVSFLVLADSDDAGPSASPGQKLCSLAFKCAAVAQGTVMWAREFTSGPEFAASASFPTLSTSILSLVRLICLRQPFTRSDSVEIALAFLRHSNSDISYQKVTDIKERSLRLLLHLLVKGEVTSVLGKIASRLKEQGSSVLDASLVRYFIGGVLEVIQPPVSIVFVRAFGGLLKAPKCVDAVRTQYFVEPHRQRLVDLLKSFRDVRSSGGAKLGGEDTLLISSVLATYQVE